MDWSRVGDDHPHLAAEAQSPQGRAFALKIFGRVIQPNFMGLQKAIERVARCEAQQLL